MCDEIRELGFEYIEASHGLSLSMMPGLLKAVDGKRIRVAGVHNFCPPPSRCWVTCPMPTPSPRTVLKYANAPCVSRWRPCK